MSTPYSEEEVNEEVVDGGASLAVGLPLPHNPDANLEVEKRSPISVFKKERRDARNIETSKTNRLQTTDSTVNKRNKDFLNALAEKKKQEREEDLAAEERLRAYKENLKAGVLKRLSSAKDVQKNVESKFKDAKHYVIRERGAQNNAAVVASAKRKKSKEDKRVPLTEEEKQKKREAEEKFKDRHAQYLEEIAEKKRMKNEAQLKLEQSHKEFRTKLAKAVLVGKKNEPPPPAAPSSPCPSPIPFSLESGESAVSAAGSGTAAVRATRKLSGDDTNAIEGPSTMSNHFATKEEQEKLEKAKIAEERIRKRQQEHLEKTKQRYAQKVEEQQKKEALYEKRARLREQRILQEAAENREKKMEGEENKKADKSPVSSTQKKEQAAKAKEALSNFMSRLAESTEKRNEKLIKTGGIDMDESRWRKMNGLDDDVKVFIITGFYPAMKRALLDRGWFENSDRDSKYFDLKWTINSKHIDHHEIQPYQVVNHFARASTIVTKIGIMKNLRNLRWFANVNIDRFFPRCYDLNDLGDKDDFCSDFKCVEAESILKTLLLKAGVKLPPKNIRPKTATVATDLIDMDEDEDEEDEDDNRENGGSKENQEDATCMQENATDVLDPAKPVEKSKSKKKKKKKKLHYTGIDVVDSRDLYEPANPKQLEIISKSKREEVQVNPAVLRAALRVCHKMTRSLDDEYIDAPVGLEELLVEPEEWDCLNPRRSNVFRGGAPKPEEEKEVKKKIKNFFVKEAKPKELTAQEKKALARKTYFRNKRAWKPTEYELRAMTDEELLEVLIVLDALRINPRFQSDLNGNPSKNVWIIKPAGKSRGRGIQVFDDYDEIMDVTDSNGNGQESQWVAQKYVENPMLILGRKFDIRQWVLVTDWNPLTLYFYSDSYLRFCATDYSLDDLKNKYVHLANNSISKHAKNFDQDKIEGNMWHSDQMIEHLNEYGDGQDLWTNRIQKQMKQIVAWSTMSVQDMVQNRKRSCELYGYDFMVDSNLDVFLIEVNSSPACDYSTKVTEKLVKEMLPDAIKVVVDYEYSERKKKTKNIDLGKWECIYRSKTAIAMPKSSLAAELQVAGKEMKNPNPPPTRKNVLPGSHYKKKEKVISKPGVDSPMASDITSTYPHVRQSATMERLQIISPERKKKALAEKEAQDTAMTPNKQKMVSEDSCGRTTPSRTTPARPTGTFASLFGPVSTKSVDTESQPQKVCLSDLEKKDQNIPQVARSNTLPGGMTSRNSFKKNMSHVEKMSHIGPRYLNINEQKAVPPSSLNGSFRAGWKKRLEGPANLSNNGCKPQNAGVALPIKVFNPFADSSQSMTTNRGTAPFFLRTQNLPSKSVTTVPVKTFDPFNMIPSPKQPGGKFHTKKLLPSRTRPLF